MTDPRTDWSTTSFSEMSTLASCEEKWYRRYVLREPTETGKKAALGIALHAAEAALWEGKRMPEATRLAQAALIEDKTAPMDDEMKADFTWLMNRYATHYAEDFGRVTGVEGTEMEMVAELDFPGTGHLPVIVKARIDQLLVVEHDLVLVERKSSGNKDALKTATVAPQFTLYWWLLQQNGYEPRELWVDHTYTYHWKPSKPTQTQLMKTAIAGGMTWPSGKARVAWAKESVEKHPGIDRPTAESFTLLRTDRTDEQIEMALQWARNILIRRNNLLEHQKLVIRNIGSACSWCDHRLNCWEGMSFRPEEFYVSDES